MECISKKKFWVFFKFFCIFIYERILFLLYKEICKIKNVFRIMNLKFYVILRGMVWG